MENLLIIVGLIIVGLIILFISKRDKTKRYLFIDDYLFPNSIDYALKKAYPHLIEEDIKVVKIALKAYLKLYVLSNRGKIVIPSRIVDFAWREFIKTDEYKEFCIKAFRFYLNYSYLKGISNKVYIDNDIKVVWTLACESEDIRPEEPTQLPLIFSLDSKLKIDNGFKYTIEDDAENLYFNAKNIGAISKFSVYGGRGL